MRVKTIRRQLSRTINTDHAKNEFIKFNVDLEADIETGEDVVAAARSLHETCRTIMTSEVSEFYARLKNNK